jgi:hypothetical protein
MNRFKLIALASSAFFVAGLREQFCTANVEGAAGTHPRGAMTFRADAASTLTHLLYKKGTDQRHAAVCGATDYPIGTSDDQPGAAEDIFCVVALGTDPSTRLFRCATAIADNVDLFTAANGLVSTTGTTGMYKFGRSKQTAVQVGTGDYLIEAAPCTPVVV